MKIIYTSSKSAVKPKKKPKAEREQYAEWCAKYGIDPTGKTKAKRVTHKTVALPGVVTKLHIRETIKYPSLNTSAGNEGTLKPKQVYTGTNIIGIAQMHKSNAVPVFAAEDAVDIAHMRR